MEKQFYTVVDKITGQELKGHFAEYKLLENELPILEIRTELMENPYFDFKTRKFYDSKN